MSDHDDMCMSKGGPWITCPVCDLIARVRQDERSRVLAYVRRHNMGRMTA